MTGSIYGLVAMGFVLIYKSSRIFNFAQGELLLLTALVCWWLVSGVQLPIWLGLLLSVAFAVLLGLVLERFALRPLIGESILVLIMATIALSYMLNGVSILIYRLIGKHVMLFVPELIPRAPLRLGDVIVSQQLAWAFVICMVLLAFFAFFFK